MPYICGRNNKCNRMTEKYINPHTDFGFKRLFGSEFNKELLISFLNAMFHGEQNVQDVTYLNSEQLGDRTDARRAIFDVYCENDKGEKFIVEMQNVYQEFFKDRTIYYSTFPIREQAQRGGDWDFHLNPVYTIGLLNFNFADGLENAKRWHHEVKLMEVENHFYLRYFLHCQATTGSIWFFPSCSFCLTKHFWKNRCTGSDAGSFPAFWQGFIIRSTAVRCCLALSRLASGCCCVQSKRRTGKQKGKNLLFTFYGF